VNITVFGRKKAPSSSKSGDGSILKEKSPAKTKINSYPYTVQVSSGKNRRKCLQEAKKINIKRVPIFTSYAKLPGKGDWYRIFSGFYKTNGEAKKAVSELKRKGFTDAFVSKLPYAIQLGIYDSLEDANETIAELQMKGYLPYTMPDGLKNKKYRLLLGAFPNYKKAAEFAERIRKDGFRSMVVDR